MFTGIGAFSCADVAGGRGSTKAQPPRWRVERVRDIVSSGDVLPTGQAKRLQLVARCIGLKQKRLASFRRQPNQLHLCQREGIPHIHTRETRAIDPLAEQLKLMFPPHGQSDSTNQPKILDWLPNKK